MNPAGVGTSIIEQALPSPIEPMSPYASWASPRYENPLERFVDNLSPGVGTSRRSAAVNNTPPAGVGTPLRTSTPVPTQGNAVGVGATAFGTRAIPGRAQTPPGQTYLTAAQRGKGPAAGQRATTAQKAPRRRLPQPTPSSPSDAGSRRRNSASSGNGSRRNGGGGGGGGGGDDDDDDDDDDDEDTTASSVAGPSRRRRRRRADRVLNDAEMSPLIDVFSST